MDIPLWATILVLVYSAIVIGLAVRFVYYARLMLGVGEINKIKKQKQEQEQETND